MWTKVLWSDGCTFFLYIQRRKTNTSHRREQTIAAVKHGGQLRWSELMGQMEVDKHRNILEGNVLDTAKDRSY